VHAVTRRRAELETLFTEALPESGEPIGTATVD